MSYVLTDRACKGFLRWGWLLPAFMPITQILGRSVFETLHGVYFLWGLLALNGLWKIQHAPWRMPFFQVYALLLVIWCASLIGAADFGKGVETLSRYLQFSLTGLFTYLALQHTKDGPLRLVRMLSLSALLSIAVLYAQLPYFYLATEFNPTTQLREDNLPLLLPFVLAAFWLSKRQPVLVLGVVMLFMFYVMVSQGRAALLGLTAGVVVFAALAYKFRMSHLIAIAFGIMAVGALFSDSFLRGVTDIRTDFPTLDKFTSGRATLWVQALSTPPDNLWLGVGLGNVTSHPEILKIGDHAVKHLHNFIFDAWYETGLIGLAALLALFGTAYVSIIRAWKRLASEDKINAAAAIAGSAAIIVAGLFSYSYTSRQFTLYLYLFFAIMLEMSRRAHR